MRFQVAALLALAPLLAENWPGFRGPGARGVAGSPNLAVRWNVETGENIAWKTAIPGLGLSSPVIWDDLVFLTSAISSNPDMVFESKLKGQRDDRQDGAEQEFRVIAVDKRRGRIVWNQLAARAKPRVLRHPHNSYASPTAATDGKVVIAFFGSEGLFSYDLKGRQLWKKDLGALDQGAFDAPDYQWGTASSPVLWKGKVFLQVDMQKGSFLAAFDAQTGRELWRTPRDVKPSWSTPTVVEGPRRTEIVANGVEHVIGYDAETGKELWRLKGTSMISVPTPFTAGGLLYVFTGYFRFQRRAYAIKPGASGDITGSQDAIAWMREEAPYLSTPVVSGGYVYALGIRGAGILTVYDALTGATAYQQRIGQGRRQRVADRLRRPRVRDQRRWRSVRDQDRRRLRGAGDEQDGRAGDGYSGGVRGYTVHPRSQPPVRDPGQMSS
ncbi:MAG TPA: PQQ-binding-like beta-propeller repeat protein [Bryobacteraceae bacterium]|nr:PQQ-binding-like beta-propeller repeat protein [Bryobacteraceae bacterium]